MSAGGEMVVAVREDAAHLARQGQTSFEAFVGSEIPPWRSVSDSEGIAAIALLACGQGSVSRSSSRGDPAPNGRVDSSAWPDLLASGGKTPCPPGGARRFRSPSSGDEDQGTTTNSNSGESSSNSGGGGGARPENSATKPLELGPMPALPPFGGYRPDGGGSGGGSGSGSRSGSGTGSRSRGDRRKAGGSRNSPTDMHSRGAPVSTSFIDTLFDPFGRSSSSSSIRSSSSSSSNSNSGGSAAVIPRSNAGGGSSLVGAHPADHPAAPGGRGGRGGGGNSSSLGVMTPPSWRTAQQQNDVGPMRQRSFDPDKEIETTHKDGDALLPQWVTASAAAAEEAAAKAAAVQVSVPDRVFATAPAAAPRRQKDGVVSAGTCVQRPSSRDWEDWEEATAVRNDDHGGGGGGGGGGENGRRVEYLNDGNVVPSPPSSSSTSFSLRPHPSCMQPGAGLGSGPAPMDRPGSRRNGGHDDSRQRTTVHRWAPQPPPMLPAAAAAYVAVAVEHPIKPQRARSYDRPGRAQMHAQHHHHHQHHHQPPILRRGRPEDQDKRHEMEMPRTSAASAAATASASPSAAAAAAPARTPSPPTAPISPPPSPGSAAAAVAPNREQGKQQQQQHSTGKVGAPGNEFNLLAMMIPDLTRLGSVGKAEGRNPQCSAAGGASPRAGADPLVGEHLAMLSVGGGYPGAGGMEGASLDEEAARKAQKKVSIARYLRKRLRRPYVKAERDQDPNRQIQNQSRMRPRKQGKFCKNAPDFIAITRVQASSNRSISGEMPVRDPSAPIRGAQTGARGGGGVVSGSGSGSRIGVGGSGMSAVTWPALGRGIKQQ